MRGKNYWMIATLALVLLGTWSCAPGDVDDPDAPSSVLEVVALDNPPVRATLTGTSCGYIVEDWNFLAENKPKNIFADVEENNPFNDLVMIDVTIEYSFINPSVSVPTRVIGTGAVAVPINDTGILTFAPISFDDLIANDPAIQGKTANLMLTFRGRSVSGVDMTYTLPRQLFVEGCAAP